MCVSCSPSDVNRQAVAAAAAAGTPVVATGGDSVSRMIVAGVRVVGSSGGSVATTATSKAISYAASLVGHFNAVAAARARARASARRANAKGDHREGAYEVSHEEDDDDGVVVVEEDDDEGNDYEDDRYYPLISYEPAQFVEEGGKRGNALASMALSFNNHSVVDGCLPCALACSLFVSLLRFLGGCLALLSSPPPPPPSSSSSSSSSPPLLSKLLSSKLLAAVFSSLPRWLSRLLALPPLRFALLLRGLNPTPLAVAVAAANEASAGLGELAILAGAIAGTIVVLVPALYCSSSQQHDNDGGNDEEDYSYYCGSGNGGGSAGGGILAALVAGKAAGILTPFFLSAAAKVRHEAGFPPSFLIT